MYVYHPEERTAHSSVNTVVASQLSFKWRQRFNICIGNSATCWRCLEQVIELLTEVVFPLPSIPPTVHQNVSRINNNIRKTHTCHFIPYPTIPQELAPVYAGISEYVTHGSWNCNFHFDKMHFIFSCVISNQCLWVLISVPRSLLLLTWETDTFLNAFNCLEKLTWTPWPSLQSHRFPVGEAGWYKGITFHVFTIFCSHWDFKRKILKYALQENWTDTDILTVCSG